MRHIEVERGRQRYLSVRNVCGCACFAGFGKGTDACRHVILLQFGFHHGVVGPIDEVVLRPKVLQYAHLSIYITLHAVVITVQMVGRDVEQHGDMRLKAVHVFELKAAQLDNIPLVCAFGHLQSQTTANVSA